MPGSFREFPDTSKYGAGAVGSILRAGVTMIEIGQNDCKILTYIDTQRTACKCFHPTLRQQSMFMAMLMLVLLMIMLEPPVRLMFVHILVLWSL